MKKIGKKLNFITKIMLVIGLLVSNLAPLKIVFAYEKSETLVITKNEDKSLEIEYTDELLEEEKYNLVVTETYTYLDDTKYSYFDGTLDNDYKKTEYEDAFSIEDSVKVTTILNDIVFDGTYKVEVLLEKEVTDGTELVAYNEYVEEVKFEEGITTKVFNAGVEVNLTDGKYTVLDGDTVVTKFLSGGLAPTWKYTYDETEYTGLELVAKEFTDTLELNGHLYGEHSYNKTFTLSSENFVEDKVYEVELGLMYKSYLENDTILNQMVDSLGLSDRLYFSSDNSVGNLYVYPDLTNVSGKITAYDLISLLKDVTSATEITYKVFNGSEEIQNKYQEYVDSVEIPEMTEEEFFDEYLVDEEYYIILSCGDLEIAYKVLLFADVNEDGEITTDDVIDLIDKVLELDDINEIKDDINEDSLVDVKDVVSLFEIIKNESFVIQDGEEIGQVTDKLVVNETEIYSGDEFTVDYYVSLDEYSMNGITGLFSYDKEKFELVNISNKTAWEGNVNGDKFLYIGEDSLELNDPIIDEETKETTYSPVEYVVLTATFKALEAGEHKLEVKDTTFISGVNTLKYASNSNEVVVVVNKSSDNALASLTVGGEEIVLTEDVLDYEISVEHDVLSVLVDAVTRNLRAKVTSIIAPEELVEGKNVITITVEAENGDIKVYTVVVNKKSAPEEEAIVTQTTYTSDDVEDDEIIETPIEEDEELDDEEVVEDDGKLSRIIIIILILLVIAGLIYLIFKDEDDDETKKANKEINKMKKADEVPVAKKVENNVQNKKPQSGNKKTNNKKGERK